MKHYYKNLEICLNSEFAWVFYQSTLAILFVQSKIVILGKQKGIAETKYRLITKICDWAKVFKYAKIKKYRVTILSFCQSDPPMSESFLQNDKNIHSYTF